MEVGVDTYVTVAEANTYVSTHYRSNSAPAARWAALSESDKLVLLLGACTELEQLPFQGRKAVNGQLLTFPRRGQDEVPQAVKSAQVELALWMSDDVKQGETEQRKSLQEQGVTGFSIGGLSESYGPLRGGQQILCSKAKLLLSRYLNGAYAIC